MVAIILTPNIRKVCINKINCSKMLHLVVEINQALFEGLVEIGVSMSIMVASVVRKLGVMHLVLRHGTYKVASSITTRVLGRITNILIIVGKWFTKWFSLLLILTIMTFF